LKPSLQQGDLLGLTIKGRPQIALLIALKGTRALVRVSGSQREQLIPIRDLTIVQSRPIDLVKELTLPTCNELSSINLPVRDLIAGWRLLEHERQTNCHSDYALSFAALAELLLSSDRPLNLAALWLWLNGDQPLFRLRRDQLIEARSQKDVKTIRQERRNLKRKQQEHNYLIELLRQPQTFSAEQWMSLTSDLKDTISRLILLADNLEDQLLADTKAFDLLNELKVGTTKKDLIHWLVTKGWRNPHTQRIFNGTIWSRHFGEDIQEQANKLLYSQEPLIVASDSHRHDLTHLRTYTIDDAQTQEIDDAISLQKNENKTWIWIHIADPARLIDVDTPLDIEARNRATSLYLSEGVRPMLPMGLATEALSLRAGRRCAALSVAVALEQSGAIALTQILRSWICPRYRLTYEDGDELIELAPPGDEDLAILDKLLSKRQMWRQQQGALQLEQAEGRFDVEDEQPMLRVVEPTPSRQLVSEAMILMGAVVAEFGIQHKLALPYRSQPPVELPTKSELNQLRDGPIRNAAIKRCLSRGVLGTRPMPHFSLGLSAYVQASSPIRRYSDLLAHRQVIAQLEGTKPLSEEELMEQLDALNSPLRQAQQISREDQNHWQQVWFNENRDAHWPAVFLRWLRPQDQLALVHVEKIAMDLACKLQTQREPQPGQSVIMTVLSVDPLINDLQLIAR